MRGTTSDDFSCLFYFAVTIFDLLHDVEAMFHCYKLLTACNLQFHGHHSCFRKDFQMLLAVNIGPILH